MAQKVLQLFSNSFNLTEWLAGELHTELWQCPAAITSVTVSCWGHGAPGGSTTATSIYTSGGGGGGAYASSTLPVIPGQIYTISFLAGNSGYAMFQTDVRAANGKLPTSTTTNVTATPAGGVGGAVVDSQGTIVYAGGAGGSGYRLINTSGYGGGGGGSAGPSGNGSAGGNASASKPGIGGTGYSVGGIGAWSEMFSAGVGDSPGAGSGGHANQVNTVLKSSFAIVKISANVVSDCCTDLTIFPPTTAVTSPSLISEFSGTISGASGSGGTIIRITNPVPYTPEGMQDYDAVTETINTVTENFETVTDPIWALDLSEEAYPYPNISNDDRFLAAFIGDVPRGTRYIAIASTTGNPLTDTNYWLPLVSDPGGVLAFVEDIITAGTVIASGSQSLNSGSSPTDYVTTLDINITDADTSITAGNILITGTDAVGETIQEGINIANGGTQTYVTTNGFKTVTSISISGLSGNTGADEIHVQVTNYNSGVLRDYLGNTYLSTTTAPHAPPPSTGWLLVPLGGGGGYSATTAYTVGQYVQEIRPWYAFRSWPKGRVTTLPATETAYGPDYEFITSVTVSGNGATAVFQAVDTTPSTITLALTLADASLTTSGLITNTTQTIKGAKTLEGSLAVTDNVGTPTSIITVTDDTITIEKQSNSNTLIGTCRYIGISAAGGFDVTDEFALLGLDHPDTGPDEAAPFLSLHDAVSTVRHTINLSRNTVTMPDTITTYTGATLLYNHTETTPGAAALIITPEFTSGIDIFRFVTLGASTTPKLAISANGINRVGVWGTDLIGNEISGGLVTDLGTAPLSADNGGTGTDSSGSTGIAHIAAGVWSFSAVDLNSSDITDILQEANGGTGIDSSASTGIAHVASGTWSFSAVDLNSSDITDILQTDNGGLGVDASAWAADAVPIADGAGAFSEGPIVDSGSYTPTVTGVSNTDSVTAHVCHWIRLGTVVTVGGALDVDPTTTATVTKVGISLPVSCSFSSVYDVGGSAGALDSSGECGAILADTTNERAQLEWICIATSTFTFGFTFTYRLDAV